MISTKVYNQEVSAMLARMAVTLSPVGLTGFLEGAIDPYLRGRLEERFENEGDEVSGPWKPLSEATQNIREFMGFQPDHPINVRTGEMKEFLTQDGAGFPEPWGASLTLPPEQPTGELYDKVSRAQRGEGRTPARPVMGMDATDLAFTMAALSQFIERGIVP